VRQVPFGDITVRTTAFARSPLRDAQVSRIRLSNRQTMRFAPVDLQRTGRRACAQAGALFHRAAVAFPIFAAALILAACRTVAPDLAVAVDVPARIWDVRGERFVDERDLVTRLTAARFRLLGEIHDNPRHHAARARIVTAIAAQGARPAVVFEPFDLAHDDALTAAQSRDVDADALAQAGELDRKAWRWPLHRPIVEAALAAGLPVRAGNVPAGALMRLARAGPAALPNTAWRTRLDATAWDAKAAEAMRTDIVRSHCNALPEDVVPTLALAQRIRDAAMAQALAGAATADGAILIAGNGHVRGDLGVPRYVNAPGLVGHGATHVSVAFLEIDAGEADRDEFAREAAAAHPGFDYLWFTAPTARPDPCATFGKSRG